MNALEMETITLGGEEKIIIRRGENNLCLNDDSYKNILARFWETLPPDTYRTFDFNSLAKGPDLRLAGWAINSLIHDAIQKGDLKEIKVRGKTKFKWLKPPAIPEMADTAADNAPRVPRFLPSLQWLIMDSSTICLLIKNLPDLLKVINAAQLPTILDKTSDAPTSKTSWRIGKEMLGIIFIDINYLLEIVSSQDPKDREMIKKEGPKIEALIGKLISREPPPIQAE